MSSRLWIAAAALLLAAGCAHSRKTASAASGPADGGAVSSASQESAAPAPQACSSDEDCGGTQICVASRCADVTPGLAECRTAAHFEFDRATLRPEDLPALRRAARCLAALPDEKAFVAGNCDERGTAQYNVALGWRRAHAVSAYLQNLGVAGGRVDTVSYGSESPVCTDSSEECWAKNRRADVAPRASVAASGSSASSTR